MEPVTELQLEIQRQFRQQQEKYIYYIIALSVTAIGFSIYKTSGVPLMWSQIPLGLAVLSWGLSIFCGIRFLQYTISILYTNNAYFDVIQGLNPEIGNHPYKIEAAVSGLNQAVKTNSKRSGKYYSWQERLFYAGIVLFLIWHVIEMYHLTK